MSKLRSGFRVVGANTSDGALSCWYYDTLENANHFAKHLCETTGKEVDVCRYIGSWKPVRAEFIPEIYDTPQPNDTPA